MNGWGRRSSRVALADLHLSLSGAKPMDVFGEIWRDHPARMAEAWDRTVAADDAVLLPGDLSWAGTLAESTTSDTQVAGAMARFEVVVTNVLAEHGLAARVSIDEPDIDVRRLALDAVPPGNPTVPLVAALRRGAADGAVHRGLTSQDVVDTALMMVASSVLSQVESDLVVLAERLSRLAGARRHVPCVARTLTQQAISKHLKVLEQAGLVSHSQAAQRRPRSLRPETLDAAAEWIGRHRRMWADRYDRLDEHLAALRGGEQTERGEQTEHSEQDEQGGPS